MVAYLITIIVMALLLVCAVVAHMSFGLHRELYKRAKQHTDVRYTFVDELKEVEELVEEQMRRAPHLHDVIFSHYPA